MRSKLFSFIVMGLIVVGVIAFLLRELVQDWVVIPLARLLLVDKRILRSFPSGNLLGYCFDCCSRSCPALAASPGF